MDDLQINSMGGGIIRVWTGTDVLTLGTYPPGVKRWYVRIFFRRLLHKYFDRVFKQHWAAANNLKIELMEFGIKPEKIRVYDDSEIDVSGIKKIEHNGFNILYYRVNRTGNQKYKDWVYGYDIVDQAMMMFPKLNWIELDGNYDMKKVYATADAYLRPNRHDAVPPRMVKECEALGISYYWDANFNPTIEKVEEWIQSLL